MNTPIERLIEYFGNVSATARELGLHRQEIQRWKRDGFIPYKHARRVQLITNGAITSIEVWEAAADRDDTT